MYMYTPTYTHKQEKSVHKDASLRACIVREGWREI